MRLLYIANIRLPTERAHSVQTVKMCEAFAQNNVETTLVVPTRIKNIKEDPFTYYAVSRCFKIVTLPIFNLERLGDIGYVLNLVQFTVVASIYAISQRDAWIYSRDEALIYFLSFFRKKLVWETHGWKWNFRVATLFKRVHKIVAITHAAKQRYVRSGVKERHIIVAPDGIDESFFDSAISKDEARRRLELPIDGKIAMYIGLLDEWKGFRTLAETAPALKKEGYRVVIVGGTTEQLKSKYPDVIFLGFIPYKSLAMVQTAADVLVIPNSAKSIVSSEYTSPLKLFAHMASGIPIVASRLPSLREVLDDATAYFFEPDNAENLAKVVVYAFTHEEESKEKAREALARARDYTWAKRAEKILASIKANL